MFGRNRRKLKSAAAAGVMAPPVPQKVEIRNEASNYWALALVAVVAVVLMFPMGWGMLVFLMDAIGANNPRQAAGQVVVVGACFLPLLTVIGFGAAWFVSTTFAHRQTMAEIESEARYKQLMAMRQAVSGRVQSEDYRLVRLLETVMYQAYNHLEEHGQYTKGDSTPFARDNMKHFVLAGERDEVGFTLAQKANNWLKDKGVVTKKNTVNLRPYRTFADFQELLRLEFDIPIQVNGRNALPAQIGRDGFEFIEKT